MGAEPARFQRRCGADGGWRPPRSKIIHALALPGVNQSEDRAELLAVTLALERQRGSGRVVSDCKGVVRVVAALRAKVRPPRGKHIGAACASREGPPAAPGGGTCPTPPKPKKQIIKQFS